MSFRHIGLSLTAAAFLYIAVPHAARTQEVAPTATKSAVETKPESAKEEKLAPRPVDRLMELVDKAIVETSKRRLTAGVHTPWQIVHGILALRWEMALLAGKGDNEINAIEWMASNPSFDGLPLWQATPYGGRGQP